MENSYYIRKHEWKINGDGCGTDYCIHCNSAQGIGFHSITQCKLRFNEIAFNSFLEFNNLVLLEDGNYTRRYTSDIITKEEILNQFKNATSLNNKKISKEKYFITNKL